MTRLARRGAARSVAAVAFTALALSACGAEQARDPGTTAQHSLGPRNEQTLLGLITAARGDATDRNAAGVDKAMVRLVGDVRTLRGSGQLTDASAARLESQALAAEVQAAAELRPRPTVTTVDVVQAQPPAQPGNSAAAGGGPGKGPGAAGAVTTPANGNSQTQPGNGWQQSANPGGQQPGDPGWQHANSPKGDGAAAGPGHSRASNSAWWSSQWWTGGGYH